MFSNMSDGTLNWKALGVLTVIAGMLLAVPLASASSPPPPPTIPAGSTGNAWAYGGAWYWNDSQLGSLYGNNTSYSSSFHESGSLQLGLQVIYIQTNTSGGEMVEVYEALTIVASVNAHYQGSSSSGYSSSGSFNVNANGWYVVNDFINFTNSGQVTVTSGGTSSTATALAVENAQTYIAANVNANFAASASSTYAGTSSSYSANGSLGANVNGNAQINFAPSLGLIPMNPTTGESWTSVSNYTASGAVSANAHEYVVVPEAFAGGLGNGTSAGCPATWHLSGQSCIYANSTSGSLSATGTGYVSLMGTDLGTINLPTTVNGQSPTAQDIQLSTTGNWGFSDGVVLVPSTLVSSTSGSGVGPLSLMGGAHHPALGAAGSDEFYYQFGGAHLGVVGSNGGNLGGKSTQTKPETPQAATQAAASNLQAAQGSSSSPAGFPLMLVLVVVIVAVVVILGAVLWMGRRRKSRAMAAGNPAGPMPTQPQPYVGPQQPSYPGNYPPPPAH